MHGVDCPIVGIDLGTTYSCVAVWRRTQVEVISDDLGNKITPSCVAFAGKELGDDARNRASFDPRNTVYDAKRLIGRHFTDVSVQNDIKLWSFKVIAGRNDKPLIAVRYRGEEKLFTAEEISSMILVRMKNFAEKYIGHVVANAVVTVPTYFDDSQRQATIDAGYSAGLNIVRLINEPTAVAMAYALTIRSRFYPKCITVLIFDLGGGTLDISVLKVEDGIIDVKAVTGDTHLGGQDFNHRMAIYLAQEYSRRNNLQIPRNSRAFRRLLFACEKAKRVLSTATTATIEIDSLHEGIDFHMNITLDKFIDLNMDLFVKCMRLVEQCLRDADMEKSMIDDLILVGGSTRIPIVRDLLEHYFQERFLPNTIEPELVVAYGAAMQALYAFHQEIEPSWSLPLSVRLESGSNGLIEEMIPRDAPLPTQAVKTICLASYGETSVVISVCQGERCRVNEHFIVNKFKLEGLTHRYYHSIVVTFTVESNKVLHVTAHDEASSKLVSGTMSCKSQDYTKVHVFQLMKDSGLWQEDEIRKRKATRNNLKKDAFIICDSIKGLKLRNERSRCMKIAREILKWLEDSGSAASMQELEEKRNDIENVKMVIEAQKASEATERKHRLLTKLYSTIGRYLK